MARRLGLTGALTHDQRQGSCLVQQRPDARRLIFNFEGIHRDIPSIFIPAYSKFLLSPVYGIASAASGGVIRDNDLELGYGY